MKKRILFINGHLNVGGVEKSLIDILNIIDYEKYDVDLLLLEELGDYYCELPDGVNILFKSLKNTYGGFASCIKTCIIQRDWFSLKMRFIFLMMNIFGQDKISLSKKSLTNKQSYDMVIGFRTGICSQLASYAVNARKKVLWWHHGEINVDVKEYSELIDQCDKIVAVSNPIKDLLKCEFSNIANKIITIPNMVRENEILTKSKTMNPYDNSIINIVTVARLSEEKHIENAIYASSKLKEKGYKFKWHIVGDGIKKDELNNLIKKYKVTDCIQLLGSKTNPYPYIANADIYVHTSYVESQGLTILEALTLHIPCVVTDSRGPSDFIKDGFNGIYVSQNVEALIKGIEDLLNDKELYEFIKQNSFCPDSFSPIVIKKMLEELLSERGV